MKKYIISGIALSISCIFIFNTSTVNSPKLEKPNNTVTRFETKYITPVVIAETVEPTDLIEQSATITYPTFDELQLKYIQIRKSSDLYMIFVQQRVLRPDKFTPENIESSFEYINNYFSPLKPDYNFAQLKQTFTW